MLEGAAGGFTGGVGQRGWRCRWRENTSSDRMSRVSSPSDLGLSHLQMNENGIYKAMGEFDIFINYIEEYLLMKRKK